MGSYMPQNALFDLSHVGRGIIVNGPSSLLFFWLFSLYFIAEAMLRLPLDVSTCFCHVQKSLLFQNVCCFCSYLPLNLLYIFLIVFLGFFFQLQWSASFSLTLLCTCLNGFISYLWNMPEPHQLLSCFFVNQCPFCCRALCVVSFLTLPRLVTTWLLVVCDKRVDIYVRCCVFVQPAILGDERSDRWERGGRGEQPAEPRDAPRRRDHRRHQQVQHLRCQRQQHGQVDEIRRRRSWGWQRET